MWLWSAYGSSRSFRIVDNTGTTWSSDNADKILCIFKSKFPFYRMLELKYLGLQATSAFGYLSPEKKKEVNHNSTFEVRTRYCTILFNSARGDLSVNLFFILLFQSCGGRRRLTSLRGRLFREIEMVVTSRSPQIFRFRHSANLACSCGLRICTMTRSIPSILSAMSQRTKNRIHWPESELHHSPPQFLY